MGLDMFAFASPVDLPDGDIGADIMNNVFGEEFFYWRKHPNLHGWMENLYRSRHNFDGMFNGIATKLTEDDLKLLKEVVEKDKLPETKGFFFGSSYRDKEEQEQDLEFIEKALEKIKEGQYVYYYSSW
jgi:hypothetical protein